MLMEADIRALPEDPILTHLVDLYFIHIDAWCRILHQETTLKMFRSRSWEHDEGDQILLHSMVATTLRFVKDRDLDEETKAKQHDRSKKKVLSYGLENSTVKSLQAMVILALDRVGSTNEPPAWIILAIVARSVVLLGLADESAPPTALPDKPSMSITKGVILCKPADWVEEEGRRRLFWMVYLLDRYGTIVTAHDFALNDQCIKRRLPCRDDKFAENERVHTKCFQTSKDLKEPPSHDPNTDAFALYFEVLEILSRVHNFLRKPMDISTRESVQIWVSEYHEINLYLTSWWERLPPEYGSISGIMGCNAGTGYSAGNQREVPMVRHECDWVMLHATYHT